MKIHFVLALNQNTVKAAGQNLCALAQLLDKGPLLKYKRSDARHLRKVGQALLKELARAKRLRKEV